MTGGLHQYGEEWYQKFALRQDTITRPAGIDLLLYDDATDTLAETDDVSAITTEPTGGDYARQSLSLDSTDLTLSLTSGDVRVSGSVTFGVDGATNTPGTVDAYAIVASFTSDVVNSETGANPHILVSDLLRDGNGDPATYTLSQQVAIDQTARLDQD